MSDQELKKVHAESKHGAAQEQNLHVLKIGTLHTTVPLPDTMCGSN